MALRVKINPEKIPDRSKPLSIHKLTVLRQSHKILHDISFELNEGEILGIIGESGSGKSTLIQTIVGTINVDKESIRYHHALCNSIDFMKMSPWERYSLGIHSVFNDKKLFRDLSVRENFIAVMPHSKSRILKSRIDDIVELFPQMKELLDTKAKSLNKGQKQIVALARSIIVFPSILIIEEPVCGLDPVAIQAVNSVLSVLTTGSISILITGRNKKFITEISDRTLVLSQGMLQDVVGVASRGNEWKPQ